MEELAKRYERTLDDIFTDLKTTLGELRLLAEVLRELPEHDDIPYLMARDNMATRTAEGGIRDLKRVLKRIAEVYDGRSFDEIPGQPGDTVEIAYPTAADQGIQNRIDALVGEEGGE